MTLPLVSGNLSAPELQAVVAIWKRERRILSTAFGGTSMLPHILSGQTVRVMCGQMPVAGDVLVYRFGNQIRVHRVVAKSDASQPGSWILTWGDNNALPDEPARWPQVIGVLEGLHNRHVGGARRLLVRCLTWRCADVAELSRRVALAYRIRAAWQSGPWMFAKKSIRALMRGRSPC